MWPRPYQPGCGQKSAATTAAPKSRRRAGSTPGSVSLFAADVFDGPAGERGEGAPRARPFAQLVAVGAAASHVASPFHGCRST